MLYNITDLARAGARKLSQLDYVTNNIANSSTSGFKAEHMYYSMKGKNAQEGAMTELGSTVSKMDFSQGTLRTTGNVLDLAIEGDGFFTIQTKKGDTYTRNGSFVLNTNNELVTPSGEFVLGESGKIVLSGGKVNVDQQGSIYVDEALVGKLKIAAFENPQALTRSANGGFVNNEKAGLKSSTEHRIASGFVESSNVNAVREMTDMMEIQRTFETYQKMILTLQDLDKIATNRIGKVI